MDRGGSRNGSDAMRILIWFAIACYACTIGPDSLVVAFALVTICFGHLIIPSNGNL